MQANFKESYFSSKFAAGMNLVSGHPEKTCFNTLKEKYMEKLMTDDQILNAWDDICKVLNKDNDDLKTDILNHVGNKWSLFVIQALGTKGTMRFSNLQKHIKGISQKMLTKCLRELERDGLISRSVYPEVPPKVEYELTPLGRGLLVQVTPLWFWIAKSIDQFREARANFGKN